MRRIHCLSLACLLGACQPPTDSAETGESRDSAPGDTSPQDSADTADTSDTDACLPDHDGSIRFDEFVADPALGIQAMYTVNAAGETVSVAGVGGVVGQDGLYAWDFSAIDTSSDSTWTVALQEPEGAWFQEHFQQASYTVGLDASEAILGIYRVNDSAERLELLGMATAEPDGGLLVYQEPVVVFEFPLTLDNSWANDQVQADGSWEGQDYPIDYGWAGVVTLEHSYSFHVDRAGVAQVPLGGFDVLRLRLDQVVEATNSISGPFATETMISYFYLAECTGLVARIRSTEGETDPDFERASEYLRLGF